MHRTHLHTCSSPRCEEGQGASTEQRRWDGDVGDEMGYVDCSWLSKIWRLYWESKLHNEIIFQGRHGLERRGTCSFLKFYFATILQTFWKTYEWIKLHHIGYYCITPNKWLGMNFRMFYVCVYIYMQWKPDIHCASWLNFCETKIYAFLFSEISVDKVEWINHTMENRDRSQNFRRGFT